MPSILGVKCFLVEATAILMFAAEMGVERAAIAASSRKGMCWWSGVGDEGLRVNKNSNQSLNVVKMSVWEWHTSLLEVFTVGM